MKQQLVFYYQIILINSICYIIYDDSKFEQSKGKNNCYVRQ